MGTPLTGSSVASTYTGLLKNTDNSTVSATLKAISDGSGNDSALQISSVAVNATNDFSVNGAASKFTVASASGNTLIAGTLGVTGATSLSSLATSGAATIGGALNVTGATTLTGNLAVPGNLAVTGTSTLTGATAVTSTLGVTGNFAVNTNKLTVAASSGNTVIAGTLGVTGATTLATVGASTANISTLNVSGLTTLAELDNLGDADVGGTLDVVGLTTLAGLTLAGDLAANGNTTLGNAGTDTLAINSDNITVPNLTTVTVDLAADKVLIKDATDSKVRLVAASSLGISAATAPQVKQTLYQDSTAGASPFVATSTGSGTEITVLTTSITPRSTGSTVLVSIAVNYSGTNINYGAFRITRNGTEIGSNNIGSSLYGIAPFTGIGPYSSEFFNSQFIQILDSPASASSVTYKIHLYATGATFPSMWVNKTYQDVLSGTNSSSAARVSSSMILQEYFA